MSAGRRDRATAARIRRLLWRAHAEAWDTYQRLHDRSPDLFPYGGRVERAAMDGDVAAFLRFELNWLARELEETSR